MEGQIASRKIHELAGFLEIPCFWTNFAVLNLINELTLIYFEKIKKKIQKTLLNW